MAVCTEQHSTKPRGISALGLCLNFHLPPHRQHSISSKNLAFLFEIPAKKEYQVDGSLDKEK